jgi:hypothetical protein
MGTFIRAAQEVMRTSQLSPDELSSFQLVFKARTLLQQVHSKSELNIDNIESLFGVFEMAALLGRLGTLTLEEVEHLREAINRVIATTIETRVKYPVGEGPEGRFVQPPKPYADFVDLISDISQRERRSVSIITFNYDLALDYSLHFGSVPLDYCMSQNDTTSAQIENSNSGTVDLLKLHGSLNWSRCRQCNALVAWKLEDYFHKFRWPYLPPGGSALLQVSRRLDRHLSKCCGAPLIEKPLIVPPTWNKGTFHSELSAVWRTAASHLAEAENVVIIGYSLPDTDEFFRHFYALGSVGDTIFNTFSVVDKDPNVFEKFKNILGPTARACFTSMLGPFEEKISSIREHLGASRARTGHL